MTEVKKSLYEMALEFPEPDYFYQWLMDLGRFQVEDWSDLRRQENFVSGCNSQVWIRSDHIHQNGTWRFVMDSDTQLMRGLLKVVGSAFAGKTTDQIRAITFHHFKPIAGRLSGVRQRGLQQIINHIHTQTGATTQ